MEGGVPVDVDVEAAARSNGDGWISVEEELDGVGDGELMSIVSSSES